MLAATPASGEGTGAGFVRMALHALSVVRTPCSGNVEPGAPLSANAGVAEKTNTPTIPIAVNPLRIYPPSVGWGHPHAMPRPEHLPNGIDARGAEVGPNDDGAGPVPKLGAPARVSSNSRLAVTASARGPQPHRKQEDRELLATRVLWKMPYGLYVIGSRGVDPDVKQLMTANWVTQLSFAPKLIGIGIEQSALTHQLIETGQCFTVCFIDREDRAIVRKFTKPVEVDVDARTLNGFEYIERVTGAPILAQSVAFLDCELRERVPTGGHTLFIGEIVDCGFLRDEDSPVLRMEDTRMNYGG